MIDWVSIVRHSRRRFSDYMYGVPVKVHKRRTKRACLSIEHGNRNVPRHDSKRSNDLCGCCWNHVSSLLSNATISLAFNLALFNVTLPQT